jgi:hypothetical protein
MTLPMRVQAETSPSGEPQAGAAVVRVTPGVQRPTTALLLPPRIDSMSPLR